MLHLINNGFIWLTMFWIDLLIQRNKIFYTTSYSRMTVSSPQSQCDSFYEWVIQFVYQIQDSGFRIQNIFIFVYSFIASCCYDLWCGKSYSEAKKHKFNAFNNNSNRFWAMEEIKYGLKNGKKWFGTLITPGLR